MSSQPACCDSTIHACLEVFLRFGHHPTGKRHGHRPLSRLCGVVRQAPDGVQRPFAQPLPSKSVLSHACDLVFHPCCCSWDLTPARASDQKFLQTLSLSLSAGHHQKRLLLFFKACSAHAWHLTTGIWYGVQLGLFNHSSWVDAIAMMWLFAPSGVSRASNADIPVVGTCIRSFQNIYIPDDKLAREPHKQPASNASPMSNGNMNGDVAGTGGSVAKPYSQLIQERQVFCNPPGIHHRPHEDLQPCHVALEWPTLFCACWSRP